jgi:excisionase family DNA binding protein
MKIRNSIKKEIIAAAVGMLSPFVEDLTPTKLVAALEAFDGNKETINPRPEKPYTIQDVQELLGISRPTVYRLFKKNQFSRLKIGRATRIPAHEVRALLKGSKENWLQTFL